MNDVEFDLGGATPDNSQTFRRGIRNIDNASDNVGASVINPDRHGPTGSNVCDT